MIRIAHLTTAHTRNELRVHLKECNSLAVNYEVHLMVADGKGEEKIGDVYIHDIGLAGNRFKRMILRPWKMLIAARKLKAKLYHFHDPELLLVALFLLFGNTKVIYDSHEDTPRTILNRAWIPRLLRPVISGVFEVFENFVAYRLSAIIGATPHITERFLKLNPHSININNFPLADEIGDGASHRALPQKTSLQKARNICYIGGIGKIRGIKEMVQAMEFVDARLTLVGSFENEATEREMRQLSGWEKVDYRGQVSRLEVQKIMTESQAGLVFFHPEPNHINAQPNKLFEYMAAELPVLASNFPLWEDIILKADAGLVADPLNPKAIAELINDILNDPVKAAKMGKNGRKEVLKKYLWTFEEKKLLTLYQELLF